MKTVIFACVHNAGRSQMSAALFGLLADPTKARAISAGTNPGPHVHPDHGVDSLGRRSHFDDGESESRVEMLIQRPLQKLSLTNIPDNSIFGKTSKKGHF